MRSLLNFKEGIFLDETFNEFHWISQNEITFQFTDEFACVDFFQWFSRFRLLFNYSLFGDG